MNPPTSGRDSLPVAIPWYQEDQWQRWRELSCDQMSESHESWLAGAEKAVKQFTKERVEVHCVEIDIDEFIAWATSQGLDFNGHARATFAGSKLSKTLLIPDTPVEDMPSEKQLKEMMHKLAGRDLSRIWEPYLRRPRAAICPIFRDVISRLEQFGSGVLLRIGAAHFMLTAAHVFDEMENHSLSIPSKDGFDGLSGVWAGTRIPKAGKRQNDRYDVCYIRLDPSVVESLHDDLLFLDAEDCDPFDTTAKNDCYTMIGYPARKSETRDTTVSTFLISLSGDGVDDGRYELLNRERKSHILVQHRRNKALSYSTTKRTQSPHPVGMSGGGVFAWDKSLPRLSALKQPRLVGIITEYHASQNVFVSTRLGLHLWAIHRNNPDLPISPAPIDEGVSQ